MPSSHLKNFKKLWSHTCKSMWIELAALAHLNNSIRGRYSEIGADSILTEWIYAPECNGRIDDTKPEMVLSRFSEWTSSVALSRVVLLSAGFESYFESFLSEYLSARPKFTTTTGLSKAGNKVMGEVMKTRGLSNRVQVFADETGSKIKSLTSDLDVLRDVYLLRNTIAHDAAVPDANTVAQVKSIALREREPMQLSVATLVATLAPPVIRIADTLDSKIKLRKAEVA